MYKYNGCKINIYEQLTTTDGIQHAAGSLLLMSSDELAALGIIEVDDVIPPSDLFFINDEQADGSYKFIERPIEQCRLNLKANIKKVRKAKELAGVVVDGVTYSTTPESLAAMASIHVALTNGFVTNVDFKALSGFVVLTLDSMTAIMAAVTQYSQACFTAEKQHSKLIDTLGSASECVEYDVGAFWPS